MKLLFRKNSNGFGLAEVIVSAAIISVAMVAILNAYSYFLRVEDRSVQVVQASYLAEEGIEVARYWRDISWANNIKTLATGTTYYLSVSASTSPAYQVWKATTTKSSSLDLFKQALVFDDVHRDATTQDIVSTGPIDSNTRQVTATVSWLDIDGATTTKSLTTYLTNLYEN
jgi:Tfp pilus assembly protein PilV